jgi:tetratricopeptide (TPR) repeat protein
MPEVYLMMAEAAGLEGNDEERTSHLRRFIQMASTPAYQTMYNRYLAVLAADEFDDAAGCVAIAKKEIANRPTPQSYELLAWGYYKQNNIDQALDVVRRHVERRTDEPIINYHLGMIYYGQGDASMSSHYLRKALTGKIELGPHVTKIIENTLEHL